MNGCVVWVILRRIFAVSISVTLLMPASVVEASPSSLEEAYQKANAQYRDFKFPEAEALLRKRIKKSLASGMNHVESLSLVPALTLLGVLQHINGNRAAARASLQEVARLVPETNLSELDYSPTICALYEEARTEILNRPSGELRVVSFPRGAIVYLNGSYKGQTPLTIKSVPAGVHFLSFIKKDYEESVKRFKILERRTLEIAANLEESKTSTVVAVTEKNQRPFWKKPLFWIVGGLVIGAGAGLGIAVGGGGSSSRAAAPLTSTVEIETPVLGGVSR